ncbi:hypothetical protein A2Y83_05565 [Candidatus Falkowbacteria bacterium RBG_13_39_14]|uniref:Glycosyl transferase family 28 C-terminal domain-containing protein n=1 Tax=Candidatus Falkowbacteria bacterium RBG_13_39_14 TaxID=1797985 RepID=A0A1F5S7X2_9BACT|nr:MAG: hypothetical protein A2Y83_05565 [Candidatus Falkowbacteria bacterium RBG_13_39_14]
MQCATAPPSSGTIAPSAYLPTLLILGGGTGALAVNKIVVQSLPELTKICNVIHMTGGKLSNGCRDEAPARLRHSGGLPRLHSEHRYQQHLFLNNIEETYAAADLVISRAGMGVLSELAILGKPTIIIPIPDSHQEKNAKYFSDRNAAIVLNQKELTSEILISTARGLLKDKNKTRELSGNISKIMPSDGASRIAKIVMKYILK